MVFYFRSPPIQGRMAYFRAVGSRRELSFLAGKIWSEVQQTCNLCRKVDIVDVARYLLVHAFFYKNKPYKNTQEQSPGWNFDQKSIRNLFNPCTQIEICIYTKTY